jgi:putative endopeptidase
MLYAWQGGLDSDREYYFLETVNQKRFVKKYVTHIERSFSWVALKLSCISFKNHGFRTSLASKHMKKEETRDMMKLQQIRDKDLKQLMPDFDWLPC